jgi:cytochrome c-type biogenesis protein CcmH
MALWLLLCLMTAVAVFAVLWPLARRAGPTNPPSDVAIYRDQLEEIRHDQAAGLIEGSEAAAAQREVARRLIAAADAGNVGASDAPSSANAFRRRAVVLAVLALLPVTAGGIYLRLGSPALPDQPLAQRLAAPGGGPSIESLIAQVEAQLERRPDDGRGWEIIAPVYTRLGRFDDAVKARRNALRLNGENADRQAALGEALVLADNGLVTQQARQAFERALALDHSQVQAQYFMGLASEQEGNPAQAAAIWRGLLANAPPDAGWVEFIRRSLARVESPAGSNASARNDESASPELDGAQRGAMIRGMVERLAQRLQQDGSDPAGWLRLVRSYMVLGDTDKARAAADAARRALAGDPLKLRQFEDQFKALGLQG